MTTGETTRPTRHGRATAVVSAIGSVLVLGMAAASVALGSVLPQRPPTASEADVVPVAAGAVDLVCPGPPRLPTTATGDDIDYDADLGPGPSGVATRVRGAVLDGGAARMGPLGDPDAARPLEIVATADDVTGPTLIRVEPADDGRAPLLAAATWSRSSAGDLRGLAAAACSRPEASIWLVGGSTQVSTSAQLTITNSGETPARVHITGWTGTGPAPEGQPILLAPGDSRVVLLEALWLADRIAVHLQAEGGRITAAIQDSRLDGLTPAGLDYVTAAAAPGREMLIGPVPLPAYTGEDRDEGSRGPSATLRIVNPNEDTATVSVTSLGPDGEESIAGAEDLVVEAGSVSEIPLAARDAGDYGVRLRSDEPVTGAIRLEYIGTTGEDSPDPQTPPVDTAWLPATTPAHDALVTAPDEGAETATSLQILNPGTAPARVTATPVYVGGREGDPLTLTVPDAGAQSVPTDAAGGAEDNPDVAAWRIAADTPVLASLAATSSADDGTLATALPATAGVAGPTEVPVDLTID